MFDFLDTDLSGDLTEAELTQALLLFSAGGPRRSYRLTLADAKEVQ